MALELRILGRVEAIRDGISIDLGTAKERALLALLALKAGRVVSAEKLADDLWEGEPPSQALTTLRVYVSHLRKALGDGDSNDEIIKTRRPGYVLDISTDTIDASRFEDICIRARSAGDSGDHRSAANLYREALTLWRGAALTDVADQSFARAEAARLEEARLAALEERIGADLALGRHGELVGELDALTREHPLRERLWAHRMTALYRAGRQADALAAYRELRERLADDLGIDPGPEIRELERRILAQDPTLAAAGKGVEGLPTGTVTFLFTDIERSTQTVGKMGDEPYAKVQDVHRELLRNAFRSNNGVEVGVDGDAFFVAFARAGDAVAAAIDGQLALAAGSQLRVRMGIHTGEAVVRRNNYVGHDVHRAKRVCDAGHGGQILLTQTTAELVGTASMMDLGHHRLKDLEEPQHLYQVRAEGLETNFPPLRTMESFVHNLPPQRTSFIGREREIAEVRALLGEHRLVTLTGIGGCGKTRLALQLGAELLGEYPDGVFFADLSPLSETDVIVATVARAVGISMNTDIGAGLSVSAPAEELLLNFLARRKCLIIIDNCEHVLDESASVADTILEQCPNVTLLATSREALSVEGEQSWRVPSLSVPKGSDVRASEAVGLFIARAKAVRPDFDLTAQNAGAVAEICRRLDGIPLAIEFAASRVAHLPPHEIAERLDDMFRLLIGGRRRAQRQQTLQAALDWSFNLLTEPERILLRRLAVFAGSFTIPAVEGICAGDGLERTSLVDLIGSLVAKSLLHTEGAEARYRLIETVRIYAAEKLKESGEADEVRSRHRDWYQAWLAQDMRFSGADHFPSPGWLTAETLVFESGLPSDSLHGAIFGGPTTIYLSDKGGPGLDSFFGGSGTSMAPPALLGFFPEPSAAVGLQERISGDLANFRAALEWSEAEGRMDLLFRMAARLYYHWVGLGHVEEGYRWLSKARPEDLELTADERVEGLWATSSLGSLLPDVNVEGLADRAVAASGGEPSIPLFRALTMRGYQLAIKSQWTGDLELAGEARRTLEEVQRMAAPFPPSLRASILLTRGITELMLGDPSAADSAITEAAELTPADPALWGGLAVVKHLGSSHIEATKSARRYIELLQAPQADPLRGEYFYVGPSLAPAVAFAGAGDTSRARELLKAEVANTMRRKRPGGIEEAIIGFAVVAYLEGDARQASKLLGWVQARTLDVGRVLASPWGYPVFRRYIQLVREALSADDARACRAEGRAMTEEEAVALALA